MTLPKNEWPWTLDDAVAAKITLRDGGKLGVVYHYPDEAIQMHAIGSEDWPTIRRLIPSPIDQNWCAHWRNPMDMIRQG